MSKIQVLTDVLASQVAAGEVVERPASVVKELVENSLDAGARRVDVVIQRGGVALIRVTDDGSGMDRQDALLCLERHATSKIRRKEDLGAIRTLGFRGEALPSIASVSKFTLSTRERGALGGTRVVVEGGKFISVEDWGGAPGTQIEARQLFYNLPARRKFLRTEATEFSHIEQHVRVQALAHPDVSFSLTHDDRQVFHLPGGSSLLDRVRSLVGSEVAERLWEMEKTERDGITVHGCVSEPGLSRANKSLQLCFLNGRPVESPVFNFALRAGYGDALPRGQYPIVFLFVEIDPQEVDVNVHPAKREVRFRNGMAVQSTLAGLIMEALRRGRTPSPAVVRKMAPVTELSALEAFAMHSKPATPAPPMQWRAPARQQYLPGTTELEKFPAPQPAPGRPNTEAAGPEPKAHGYKILSLLAEDYALLESSEGLVILDTRAAQERILFEQARTRAAAAPIPAQRLLASITLQFPPREFDLIKPHLPTLRQLGIGAEEFGPGTIKVDALPAYLKAAGDVHGFISQVIEDIEHALEKTSLRRLDLDTLAASVSRQAARMAPPTTLTEIDSLTSKLLACEMPYCCPAGKATIIQISHAELARKFGKR